MLPLKKKLLACTLLLGALSLAACEEQPEAETGNHEPPAPPSVEVVSLTPQTWEGLISTFGVIEALEEVDVAAELSGTISAVHVNEGDQVVAGQLLLELDPQKRELALQQARREVEQAKPALEEARLKLQRRRNLAEKETISKEILDNAQLAVDASSAAYQQSLSALQLAERELADTRIVSPTDGVIDIRSVEVGEPVQAGVSLITLQSVASLRVQTWVSETDVSYLRTGSIAKVFPTGMPSREFSARIEWVGVNADSATGNFPVKLILETGVDILRPGMTVSTQMPTGKIPGALLLPKNALVDYERRRVVFIEKNGVAEIREPVLAAGLSNNLVILSGLTPGDKVIVSGQHQLIDGVQVLVAEAK